jgi:hypothetical protein
VITMQLECKSSDIRHTISLPLVPRMGEQIVLFGTVYRVSLVRYSIPDEFHSDVPKRDPIIYVQVYPL